MDPTEGVINIMEQYHRARAAQLLIAEAQKELGVVVTRKGAPTFSIADTIDKLHKGEPIAGELLRYNERLERDGVRALDVLRPVVPWSALATRDLSVASSGGANLVGVDVETAADFLRPYSVVLSVGAQTLENLRGNTVLPSVTGSASGSWLSSETATQAPSDPVFSAATLAPKNYAALTSISRHLRLTAPESEPVVRRHLSRLIGSAIDAAALNGSGASGQPTGLLVIAGTQSQSGTTLAQVGVTNMLEQVVTNGGDDRNTVFIAAPTVREALQNREVVATSGRYIWDNNTVAGKAAFATTSCPAASMVAGDFSNLVIGFFGPGIELSTDPYTGFKTGVVTVRAIVSCDVGVLFPASFCKSTSIT